MQLVMCQLVLTIKYRTWWVKNTKSSLQNPKLGMNTCASAPTASGFNPLAPLARRKCSLCLCCVVLPWSSSGRHDFETGLQSSCVLYNEALAFLASIRQRAEVELKRGRDLIP